MLQKYSLEMSLKHQFLDQIISFILAPIGIQKGNKGNLFEFVLGARRVKELRNTYQGYNLILRNIVVC